MSIEKAIPKKWLHLALGACAVGVWAYAGISFFSVADSITTDRANNLKVGQQGARLDEADYVPRLDYPSPFEKRYVTPNSLKEIAAESKDLTTRRESGITQLTDLSTIHFLGVVEQENYALAVIEIDGLTNLHAVGDSIRGMRLLSISQEFLLCDKGAENEVVFRH